MVEVRGVRFGYSKARTLFEWLDFSVVPGGVVGLLGKNGAGKTSLLKLVSGLVFPQDGEANLFGVSASLRKPDVLSRVYYVPEQFELPAMRIRSWIKNGAMFYPRFQHKELERYLSEFEVTGNARLTSLSHGQQKKILIAFALASGAELVILDEPTNGLDIPSKQTFRRLVAQAAGDERAFIVSTHQVRDVENLIDPVVILNDGRVVFEASIESIVEGVELCRFSSVVEAERAGALAVQSQLGSAVALMSRDRELDGAPAGEVIGDVVDFELLFAAAMNDPGALLSACTGGIR